MRLASINSIQQLAMHRSAQGWLNILYRQPILIFIYRRSKCGGYGRVTSETPVGIRVIVAPLGFCIVKPRDDLQVKECFRNTRTVVACRHWMGKSKTNGLREYVIQQNQIESIKSNRVDHQRFRCFKNITCSKIESKIYNF